MIEIKFDDLPEDVKAFARTRFPLDGIPEVWTGWSYFNGHERVGRVSSYNKAIDVGVTHEVQPAFLAERGENQT